MPEVFINRFKHDSISY